MANMPREANGLTERQNGFIRAYFLNGGNGTQAAIEAGYEASGAASRAYELLQMPTVIAVMDQYGREYLAREGAKSLGVIATLRDRAKSESVRLAAAQDLANRANAKLGRDDKPKRRDPAKMKEELREIVDELRNLELI